MNEERQTQGVLRLLQHLEPSLKRRKISMAEGYQVIKEHGLEDVTWAELARMGFDKSRKPQKFGEW